jgi:hypothetical protein
MFRMVAKDAVIPRPPTNRRADGRFVSASLSGCLVSTASGLYRICRGHGDIQSPDRMAGAANPRHAALVIRRMHICKDTISFDFATRVRCVKGHQPCVTPSVETSECVTCSHGH